MATSSWQQTDSDDSTMRMHMSIPEGAGSFPALVVIQHQAGVDAFIQKMTRRIAEAGYASVAPELYHRDGADCSDDARTRSSRLRDRNIINDVNAAASFLQRHTAVDPRRLGIIGFCMGGRIAYLMAAAGPLFKAAVVYYGGNIFRPWGRDVPSPFERTPDISCPLLAHFGEEDKNPSPDDMEKLDSELMKFDKPHDFYSYTGAGHAFMDDTKESYRRQADEASWPRTVDFLKKYLS